MFDGTSILDRQVVRWFSELSEVQRNIYLDSVIDVQMERLSEELGLHGCPNVLSDEEFATFDTPYPCLYRGLAKMEYIDSYVAGSYRASSGLYGQGVYTLASNDEEWAYKSAFKFGEHILQVKIKPDANVIDISELENRMDGMKVELQKLSARRISTAGEGEAELLLKRARATESLMERHGFFGLATGIDAYFVSHDSLKGVNTDYYVILNRTATVVRA